MIRTNTQTKKELSKKRQKLNYDTAIWKESYGEYFPTILLFLTAKCNLKCPKCFNCANMQISEDMNSDYIQKLVENNPLVNKYDIMGGEPMLHPTINQILYFMDSKEKKIGLYTNGLLLNKIPKDLKNLKINMAFHSINSNDPSDKPIANIIEDIKTISELYPLKIVYLITEKNKKELMNFAKYIEKELPLLQKITIGQIRDENDYYDNKAANIVELEEYGEIVSNFVKNYKGRLDIDIFSEGLLETDLMPKSQKYQLNRFRSVFPGGKFVDCLYDVALGDKIDFDVNMPLSFKLYKKCPITGRCRCITDKIKLKHVRKV